MGTLPVSLWANSGALAAAPAPPLRRSGVPAEGGLFCTACHATFAPVNSDARGAFKILAAAYQPGVKQKIKIELTHPEAARWGFQLTARLASDETKMAGSFGVDENVQVRCDDGQQRGAPAPCADGQVQFASHTNPSTRAGTTGGATWEVDWTPPATDLGDVVFYAAGNAANNNGTNTGDYIYSAVRRVSGPCTLSTKPAITSVYNAASGATGGFATNQLITVAGTGLLGRGAQRLLHAGDLADGVIPKEMSCLAVEVNGQRAPIIYADSGQINVQVPTTVTLGATSVRVIANPGRANELRSDAAAATLVVYAPGVFQFAGTKSAAAHLPDGSSYIGPAGAAPNIRAAKPGEVITIYATGLNATNPFWQAGEILPASQIARLRDALTVSVGGLVLASGDVLYAGLAPGAISGLYQLNIRIPASAADGDQAVVLEMGGQRSQTGISIPVKR